MAFPLTSSHITPHHHGLFSFKSMFRHVCVLTFITHLEASCPLRPNLCYKQKASLELANLHAADHILHHADAR